MLPTIKINNRLITFKIREDRAILLICFLISLIFWLLVRMSQVYSITKPVMIEEVLPADKILRSPIPNDITAIIEGRGWDLLFEFLFKNELKLRHFPESENSFNISSEIIKRKIAEELNANDLEVVLVNADNESIPIEDKISKSIPLIIEQIPSIENGHQLSDDIQFNPSHIEISGPTTLVNALESWPVIYQTNAPLKVSDIKMVAVKNPSPPLSASIEETQITIPIEAFTEKSLFVPVQIDNISNEQIVIFPEKIQVSFIVGLGKFNMTTASDFELSVEYDVSKHGNIQFLPVELVSKPDWVNNIKLSSQSVRYFVIK